MRKWLQLNDLPRLEASPFIKCSFSIPCFHTFCLTFTQRKSCWNINSKFWDRWNLTDLFLLLLVCSTNLPPYRILSASTAALWLKSTSKPRLLYISGLPLSAFISAIISAFHLSSFIWKPKGFEILLSFSWDIVFLRILLYLLGNICSRFIGWNCKRTILYHFCQLYNASFSSSFLLSCGASSWSKSICILGSSA